MPGTDVTTPPRTSEGTGSPEPRPGRFVGAVIGLLSGAVALGIAQLSAGLIGGASSPIVAVGSAAIDATPEWLKSFAIREFGSNDKMVLVAGIDLVIAICAVALGIVSVRRPRVGIVGLVGFGAIGMIAAASRPASSPIDAAPVLIGAAAGMAAYVLLRRAAGMSVRAATREDEASVPAPAFDRRKFLWTGVAAAGVAATAGKAGQLLVGRSAANLSRAGVEIPAPASPAPAVPAGADLHVPGVGSFLTPNDRFYRVDTALFVPSVAAESWMLRVHGMVDHELALDYRELLARPLIERDVTLTCVSNQVGGHYIGNARWIGAPLKDLLDEAGVHPGASQIVSRSADGFTVGTPTAVAMDGRDAMLAVAMNGVPLPLEHGFPVRMVVPGLYGYVSATKWIVDIELTTFRAYDAYWIKRGWAQQAPIKTESRIDTPRRSASLQAGQIPVAGVAWAQHRGIERVEVQIDGGAWLPAELGAQDSVDTWRLWLYRWDATPGDHTIAVRATDGGGVTQTPTPASPFPNGAAGDHTISVTVS